MLRLPPRAPVMDDHLPRGSAGDVLAHVPLDKPERQIDASRHAGRGPDRPIGNKDAVHLDFGLRKALLQLLSVGPVRRRAAPIEQSGFAQSKGADADGGNAPRALRRVAKESDRTTALATACPDGIDVYFENVGGPIFESVLPLLNRYARIPVCGLIAYYNGEIPEDESRISRTLGAVLRRSLLIRGFINTEFVPEHYKNFLKELGPLVASGKIRHREDITEGLASAPEAFIGMLTGHNFGKTLVHVS